MAPTRRAFVSALAVAAAVAAPLALAHVAAQNTQKPQVAIPQAGVPQIMTMEGAYVRAAYNNEGYVILGYQAANESLGQEWMLIEVGMTLRDKQPDYKLMRGNVTLDLPSGKTLQLASVDEYRGA